MGRTNITVEPIMYFSVVNAPVESPGQYVHLRMLVLIHFNQNLWVSVEYCNKHECHR